jgi:hypothetical protein
MNQNHIMAVKIESINQIIALLRFILISNMAVTVAMAESMTQAMTHGTIIAADTITDSLVAR